MRISCLAAFQIAWLGLALVACRTSPPGSYSLDFEETKLCVTKAAVSAEEAKMRDSTIKLLETTSVDVVLAEGGKMTSTTTVKGPGAPTPQLSEGTWKADDKGVIIQVKGLEDTVCKVDGKRLRCHKPAYYTLFSDYVLVRK